jgi:hypothetical protein
MSESDKKPGQDTKYEHVGYGWCSVHGFWKGLESCPDCAKSPALFKGKRRRGHDLGYRLGRDEL